MSQYAQGRVNERTGFSLRMVKKTNPKRVLLLTRLHPERYGGDDSA